MDARARCRSKVWCPAFDCGNARLSPSTPRTLLERQRGECVCEREIERERERERERDSERERGCV